MTARRGLAIALSVALTSPAFAQPATSPDEHGFIGQGAVELEIDKCRTPPDGTSDADRVRIGEEHYHRGETLYTQGDYKGAVLELVDSYCLVGYYTILKDIGQAYERDLGYAKAIGYFERYVRDVPDNAKRGSACAVDPVADRENVRGRIEVLKRLRAHVYIESEPSDATVTVQNDSGVAARGTSGHTFELLNGTYDVIVAAPGHEPRKKSITVEIGQPYTYFFTLPALKGQLSVQVTPPDARVFLGDRFVGVGRVNVEVESSNYVLSAEAPGMVSTQRNVTVLSGQVNSVHVELVPKPQFARKQLVVAATIGGGTAVGMIAGAGGDNIAGLGAIGGVAAGLLGSLALLPDQVPLGTSDLTITTSLVGGFTAGALAYVATDRGEIISPIGGAGILLGAATGYYFGQKLDVTPGDAAIVNSGAVWGGVAGGLFTQSFGTGRQISGGLVVSGLAMGTAGGVLLAAKYDLSRTHAALIDVGGIVGLVGGLAAVRVVYGQRIAGADETERDAEHDADFMLGGMAIGLVGAGILTRNLDTPKIPLAPTIGAATDATGTSRLTYGFGGSW